jgi:hypothetical protein
MEKNHTPINMEEAKRLQKMIKILPNEVGKFDLEDLEEIFKQDG